MSLSQLHFDVATNESTGERCLMIPHRAGRGIPTNTRIIAGSLIWTAEDGAVEEIGGARPLPQGFLDQFWSEQKLLVIPIDENGIPSRDFLITPA
ncbi:hypothetical protein [Achromobacter animicus]|uniref:hypothetical protein n=1 Tax=Achromobacter animicus TaxID=1389935 RepID=UPI00244C1BC3|nr:hypothetical protein [Achromobacter animicus]MDH0682950.1 hypothetical protein [Achromobacter animicus]